MIIQHNTGKAELCFVKVPEDAYDFEIKTCDKLYSGDSVLTYKTKFRWETFQKSNWDWATRSPEKLVIVGNPFELSEGQWLNVVDELWNGYKNYLLINEPVGNYKRLVKDTAKESGISLMESLKIYQINPHNEDRMSIEFYYDEGKISKQDLEEVLDKWEDAEERTGNWILFNKI